MLVSAACVDLHDFSGRKFFQVSEKISQISY